MKNTLYDDPEVYDILHEPGTRKDVAGLLQIERRFTGLPKEDLGLILEPACGSGRYLLDAARRGRRVAGFDLSPAMVRYAKARFREAGVPGSLFTADMAAFARRVKAGSVTLAFNLINSIRHLGNDEGLASHFRDMARVLHPRGVYAVGLSLSDYGREFPTEDVWKGRRRTPRGTIAVHQVVQYEPPAPRKGGNRSAAARDERVVSHLTITTGRRSTAKVEEATATYGLRCYDPGQWYGAIEDSPLRVLATCDERGTPLPPACPGYSIFILTRRDRP